MQIDYAAITHLGRVRRNNEDAYLVSALDGEEPLVNAVHPMPGNCAMGLLAAVADGMGGAASGEIASREGLASMAVNLFGHWGRFPAARATEVDLMRALKGAVEQSSHAVLHYAEHERTSRGMGSTLTACVVWDGHAYIAQVGDSRAYLHRGSDLRLLTTDQTLVNEMVSSGTITPEQARTHPQRSMITQALGCHTPIEAALTKVALRRGDRLLLCTDGLHGELTDEAITAVLAQALSPKRTLEVLLEEALASGGRDNVTALLLALDDPAFPVPLRGESVRVQTPSMSLPEPEPTGLIARLGRFLAGKA